MVIQRSMLFDIYTYIFMVKEYSIGARSLVKQLSFQVGIPGRRSNISNRSSLNYFAFDSYKCFEARTYW